MIGKKFLDKALNYLQGKCGGAGGVFQVGIKFSSQYVFDQFMENNNDKTLLTYVNAFNKL